MKQVTIVGAGLAGCEAAYQCAKRGIQVKLIEMRPVKYPPAFHTDKFGELVCSNSLRSNALNNAVGVLKEELRIMDSLIMKAADATAVPAGSALAVDRDSFADFITKEMNENPNIEIVHEEVTEIPEGPTIIATGPLTSDAFAKSIVDFVEADTFHFYDAAAPIIEKDSIDFSKAYFKSRYDKGEASYINCPMDQEEFDAFYDALVNAQCAKMHDFEEDINVFEGCMPIEEMAKRGRKTMLYGPLKPVGLQKDENHHPVAVVQLRQDNVSASMYNIVGFQTHLTWPEQRRVFSMIPGLENLKITRYGVMHRNSYLSAPEVLRETYQSKKRDDLFFAGQLSGVEGYVESTASGLIAGINMALLLNGKEPICFGNTCIMGSQAYYITHVDAKHFQPMNANFGIVRLDAKCKKNQRKELMAQQALARIREVEALVNERVD
ncbi:MAG: methylenetetrahydrofolate--tRNA-(uracil(54)-C(5))-methyltransferase (FADH(2)-oxidizing) TrmFO [Firmicutes bacterium]|nr:methylenetetrahydrofolate--tRNA-(uracil(54)-C(5))-methyltransferase (FADH(2)-oxidizing) TrmFO [Bacillota bacterium]